MTQSQNSGKKTLFIIAHHKSAPAIKLPKKSQVDYVRTLRLDSGQFASTSHLELGFRVVAPPIQFAIPSQAFSDSLTFFNAREITEKHEQVGVFQYRRILGLPNTSQHPVLHNYRIRSARLLKALEIFAISQKDKILVANPLKVTSLEDQYASSQSATLPILNRLRSIFQNNLENVGYSPARINPKLFFWSSLYLGPSQRMIEFQSLLHSAFQTIDPSSVPQDLNEYESRWAGFIVERLFSDYIQCLAGANPDQVMTAPAIQLNRLPGASRIFLLKPCKGSRSA